MCDNINIWGKTSYKVLKTLADEPLEQYHVRKIATMAEVSPASASLTLRDLYDQGLLKKEVIGRQTFYSAILESPVVKQFKVFDTVIELYPLIEELKESTKKIILFGSAAEGTNTEESDIDLFILTDKQEDVKGSLKQKTQISPVITTSENYQKFKSDNKPLYENIKKGIVLWREEDEL